MKSLKKIVFKDTGLPIILPTAMGLESYILKSEKVWKKLSIYVPRYRKID